MDPAHSLLDKSFPAILQVVLFSLAMVGALAEYVPNCPLLGNHRILWKKKSHFHLTDFLYSFKASGLVWKVAVQLRGRYQSSGVRSEL